MFVDLKLSPINAMSHGVNNFINEYQRRERYLMRVKTPKFKNNTPNERWMERNGTM